MFEGTGKRRGKPLGGPAEYDRVYVTQLLKYGVTEGDEIADAVMARPDGHALRRGHSYAINLVEEALGVARAATAEQQAGEQERFAEARTHADFMVDEVRVIESDATRYELRIKGKWLVLNAKQLTTQMEFRQAYLNTFHRVPGLPPAKGKKSRLWNDLVNSWLAAAQKEVLVGNATEEEVQRRAVEKAKNAIATKVDPAGLHDDMAYETSGRRYFTADAVYDRVKQLDRNFKHRDVARILAGLGCEYDANYPAGERSIPVWSEPLASAPGAPGGATGVGAQPPSGSSSGSDQSGGAAGEAVTP